MNNVIITGADGFVGSYTTAYFLAQGCSVLALGHKETPTRLCPSEKLIYLPCDIFDGESLLKKIPTGVYDTFLHFAWEGSAGAARTDANLQMRNALASAECVKVAHQLGCSRFVGAGSIMEYEVEAALHANGTRPGAGYVYGMGKQTAHGLCKITAAQVGIDFLWPMITNAYGPGETSPRFIGTTLQKILSGEPLTFTAATQHYDFVYVEDVATAFYQIARYGKPFHEYMIGSGKAGALKNFILEMLAVCAPDAVPVFGNVPFTGVDLPPETFSIKNLEEDCGYRPKTSFAEGIQKTMEWLKEKK